MPLYPATLHFLLIFHLINRPIGTTHAVLHSSSDSGGCGSGSYDAASRAKKTVSFAEKVSYHSPAVSPHPSPKKTKSCGHLCDAALRGGNGGLGGYRPPVMVGPSASAADMQYRNLITRDMVHAIQSECIQKSVKPLECCNTFY